jgi:Ca2+-transporting ATPase
VELTKTDLSSHDKPSATPVPTDDLAVWLHEKETILGRLGVDPAHGLTTVEADKRAAKYGPNVLTEKGAESPLKILLAQLTDPLVMILIGAAVVSALLGETKSVIAIALIVIANAALGVSQEYRAEKAIAALQKMSAPNVRVRRGGREEEISPAALVPGDIVVLEAGSIVPADGRVIESVNMSVQEASLTGESLAVEKSTDALVNPATPIGDRNNMVYMGTSVTYGRGVAVITATGMHTELGHIANLIATVETEPTPLQRRMAELGKALFFLSLGIVAVGTILGLINGGAIQDTFLNGVAMAVAVVPEGLPAVVTIALALGAQRMLHRRALIRKLPAVETLGSVTTICSDKTGTLTQNLMTVKSIYFAEGRDNVIEVNLRQEGASIFRLDTDRRMFNYRPVRENVEATLLTAAALCNDAQPQFSSENVFHILGDPTEAALLAAAGVHGLLKADLEKHMPRIAEVPFSSERKRMTTIHSVDGKVPFATVEHDTNPYETSVIPVYNGAAYPSYIAFMKGAVEQMVEVCDTIRVHNDIFSMDTVHVHPEHNPNGLTYRERVLAKDAEKASEGLRVLGIAYKNLDTLPKKVDVEQVEHGFTFLGFVAMIDPPRPEVMDAVARCITAGIRPVMITGDHPATAFAIGKELQIISDANYETAKKAGHIYTGREISMMSEAQLNNAVKHASVFARVSPEHKLNIVQALQSQNHIVSMTGDGVNDAPALKKADIGVAMGITGTAVSKEASSMVILDDNFATIVAAAEEGRTIYDNVRKFIKYILGSNIGEVGVLFVTQLLRLPLPLNTLQILWMNLVTDGLPALALSVEKGEADAMQRPPYDPRESVFSRGLGWYLIRIGVVIGLLGLAVVTLMPVQRVDGTALSFLMQLVQTSQGATVAAPSAYGSALWSTMVFTTLVFVQMGHALAVRSERYPIWKIGYGTNKAVIGAIALTVGLQLGLLYVPFLQDFFGTVPLPPIDFVICVILAIVTYAFVELDKLLIVRRHKPVNGLTAQS